MRPFQRLPSLQVKRGDFRRIKGLRLQEPEPCSGKGRSVVVCEGTTGGAATACCGAFVATVLRASSRAGGLFVAPRAR